MMSIEQMKTFVERAESGKADAADFVDNANEIIEVFKELIRIMEYEKGLL